MSIARVFAVALTAAIAVTGPVMAQETPEVPEIGAEEVTTGQIVSFVNALIAVERVRIDYTTRINEAESDADRTALVAEADKVAMEAVDRVVGITPGEYIAIGRAAQGSQELTDKINARFAELREKQTMQPLEPLE